MNDFMAIYVVVIGAIVSYGVYRIINGMFFNNSIGRYTYVTAYDIDGIEIEKLIDNQDANYVNVVADEEKE